MSENHVNKASFSHRIIRWMTLFVAVLLVFSAMWAQPANAGSGVTISGVPVPNVPNNPLSYLQFRSYELPFPRTVINQAQQPPVPNQGGTCVSGYLIDSYHNPLGSGWEVTLTPEEAATQTTTTDDAGMFTFSELTGGTYTVSLNVEPGWRPFTPSEFSVTLSGVGDGCADVRFKLEALPCIQVLKLDAGGEIDGEPVGIPGWGITATQGGTTLQATTDGQGIAYFYDLAPGTWSLEEEQKSGWIPANGSSSTQTVDLISPEVPGTCQVVTFYNQQVHDACIIVQKVDVAGDPIEGWQMSVTRDDGTQAPASGSTDATGQVVFDNLALGAWTVEEETKPMWQPVGQTAVQVTLEEPGFCQVVKFVNEPLGCVDGYKINDLEDGLSGWTINANNTDTGQQFSTVTDEDGYFKFDMLTLGEWNISETLQEGWEPVTPAEFTVQVTEPFQCQTVRFKNRTQFACVDVYKTDEIDGAGLPGWQITLQPAYGGEPTSGTTDGTGWVRFSDLIPGSYTVQETLQPGWASTTPESVQVDLQASGRCSVINFANIQTNMDPNSTVTLLTTPVKDKASSRHCALYYTVKPGDTVWGIGQWFGVPSSAIARVNHLNNPRLIYPGTRLCIPLGDP
jgi:LysM repeat protein